MKLKKSNAIIKSRNDLTTVEHRIVNFALVQIKKDVLQLNPIAILISDIFGEYNDVYCTSFAQRIEKLQTKTLCVQEGGWWLTKQIFQIITKKTNKSIEVIFHQDMQKHLLHLTDDFTVLDFESLNNFKNKYSFRIYELCKQNQGGNCVKYSLESLRSLLRLEKKYISFKNFREHVLEKAIHEINYHSDLSVDIEFEKEKNEGDSCVYFRFRENRRNIADFQIVSSPFQYPEPNIQNLCVAEKQQSYLGELISPLNIEPPSIQKFINVILPIIQEPQKSTQPIQEQKEYLPKFQGRKKSLTEENPLSLKEKMKRRRMNLLSKKFELKYIKEKISRDQNDISEYSKTGQFRPGDIMRFKDWSIDKAVEFLQNRVIQAKKDCFHAQERVDNLLLTNS